MNWFNSEWCLTHYFTQTTFDTCHWTWLLKTSNFTFYCSTFNFYDCMGLKSCISGKGLVNNKKRPCDNKIYRQSVGMCSNNHTLCQSIRQKNVFSNFNCSKQNLQKTSKWGMGHDSLTLSHKRTLSVTHLQQMNFKNIVSKGEIAHRELILSFTEIIHFLTKCFLSRLLQTCCMWERVKGWLEKLQSQMPMLWL